MGKHKTHKILLRSLSYPCSWRNLVIKLLRHYPFLLCLLLFFSSPESESEVELSSLSLEEEDPLLSSLLLLLLLLLLLSSLPLLLLSLEVLESESLSESELEEEEGDACFRFLLFFASSSFGGLRSGGRSEAARKPCRSCKISVYNTVSVHMIVIR